MRHLLFDRNKLRLKPLDERKHGLTVNAISDLLTPAKFPDKNIQSIAQHVFQAHSLKNSIILMMGAHVIRSGVQKYIIDLMKRGYINCLAMNGSGIIHDYEFSKIGATTESVANYIKDGQFGLWNETGELNDIISEAYRSDPLIGMGEAVGKIISKDNFPHKSISLLAAAYELNIPTTVHVGIGYDIIHQHANCDGAATGALSYNDFLKYASLIQNLENGVIMNFGSSVMAPEVFLKALSMARNVAEQEGKKISNFTTAVFDLHDIPNNFHNEPSKDNPAYFFRPWKTMLVRTVADGGESFYIKGKHADTFPLLWYAINNLETPF